MTLLRRLAAVALLATASSAPAPADIVVFQETFGAPQDDACSPSFPAGWTRIDADQRTPDPDAEFVGPAWETRHDPFDLDGNCSAVSTSWYDPVGESNDWMITPLIHVPEGSVLTWRSLAQDDFYPESYQVRYSFTTPTIPGFMANPALFTGFEESGTWSRHSVDLGAKGLTGRAVYLAFRNISDDQYFLHVDDVRVWFEDAVFQEEFGDDGGTGFCEPAIPSDWVTIDVDGNPVTTTYEWMTSAWVAEDTSPFNASDCAAFSTSFYDNSPASADDWLVTPPIDLPSDSELRWEAAAWHPENRDGYEVRYSCGGSGVAAFTAKPVLLEVPAENASWTARSIDLDEAGLECESQTVRFAFRNQSTDKDLLAIDSVEVALPILFRDGFESGFAGAWSFAAP